MTASISDSSISSAHGQVVPPGSGGGSSPTIKSSSRSRSRVRRGCALTDPSREFSIGPAHFRPSRRPAPPSRCRDRRQTGKASRGSNSAARTAASISSIQRFLSKRALRPEVPDSHRLPSASAPPRGYAALYRRPPAPGGSPRFFRREARAPRVPCCRCLAYSRACSRWWIDFSTRPERVGRAERSRLTGAPTSRRMRHSAGERPVRATAPSSGSRPCPSDGPAAPESSTY